MSSETEKTSSCQKQFCSSLPIPKLKFFGIKYKSVDSTGQDLDGKIDTVTIDSSLPMNLKPKITIQNGDVLFLNSSGEYIAFDPDLSSNVYARAYLERIDSKYNSKENKECGLDYSISIEPMNCSLPMKLSNVTLYTPTNNLISNVSNDGNHTKLGELSDQISCILKKALNQQSQISTNNFLCKTSLGDPAIFQANANSLYYGINGDLISNIGTRRNFPFKMDTATISKDLEKSEMPSLTMTGGTVQYLDTNGVYQNFDSLLYQNVKAEFFDIQDLLGMSISNSFAVRISQEDIKKPMIFSDVTLYPFQNYILNNVLDDGTIEYNHIPNNFVPFLQ